MNKSRGVKNILFGLLSQIITLFLGLVIPRLVLVNLGSESNGLLNAIANVLSYMSLLEAGVGTATLQALYKPIAQNDRDGISRIMSATNYFYRRTGTIYFALMSVIAIAFTFLIDSEIPKLKPYVNSSPALSILLYILTGHQYISLPFSFFTKLS